jgi:hypothetical protein
MMDLCAKRDEWDFVEPYVWDDMLGEYAQLKHADVFRGVEDLKVMYQLIRLERGRPRMRDVIAFVQEMRASDVERLKAKTGLGAQAAKITISTVHKVKGLEYDTVVVMPSSEKFPLNDSDGGEAAITDAAEEARLCYVGMTRARNRLYVGWPEGGRERAWWDGRPFAGVGPGGIYSTKGSPKEVVVRWSGRTENVDNGIQGYIEKHVNAGNRITLRHRDMYHNGRQVGVLKRMPPQANDLRVSNVMRYSCGNHFREHKREYWNELHPKVQQQRWFYVVLAEAGEYSSTACATSDDTAKTAAVKGA